MTTEENPRPQNTLEREYRNSLENVPAKNTFLILHDLDDSLHHRGESAETAVQKVLALNSAETDIACQTGFTLLNTIVTGRPEVALLTKPALREWLNIRSIITPSVKNQISLPLPVVFPELGSVQSFNTGLSWQSEITPAFKSYCVGTRPKLLEWLFKNYVKLGSYQFEDGNQVALSLQRVGDKAFDKFQIANEILQRWHREHLIEFIKNIKILTEGADVDFVAKQSYRGGKVFGVTAALAYFRNFKRQLPQNHMVLVDDSGEKASRHVALSGIPIITPSNATNKFKAVVLALDAGIVSKLPEFWGVIDGLYQTFLGVELPDTLKKQFNTID